MTRAKVSDIINPLLSVVDCSCVTNVYDVKLLFNNIGQQIQFNCNELVDYLSIIKDSQYVINSKINRECLILYLHLDTNKKIICSKTQIIVTANEIAKILQSSKYFLENLHTYYPSDLVANTIYNESIKVLLVFTGLDMKDFRAIDAQLKSKVQRYSSLLYRVEIRINKGYCSSIV